MINESIVIEDSDWQPVVERRLIPSPYQQAIYDWIVGGTGDAIVDAVAGSGKTTTLEEICKRLPPGRRAIYCAFNNHIVKASSKRFAPAECKTIHSIGLATVRKHLGWLVALDDPRSRNKYRDLVRKESWELAKEFPTLKREELASSLGELVDLAQATLCDVTKGNSNALECLLSLVSHFGLTLPCPGESLLLAVRGVLQAGILQASEEHIISFSDMLWLPWVWNLDPPNYYDWVLNDEVQDYNRAQLEMVLKLRSVKGYTSLRDRELGRMVFVGDPRQAIYGFSGADSASYENIKLRTSATEFPLSVSYRCPILVAREAQQIVPHIQAKPGAELGSVKWISETDLYPLVREGDLLLCRMTAPLIATCLELIQQKIPARVRGKDIGKLLVKTVQIVSEQSGFKFSEFPKFLLVYGQNQIDKLRQKPDSESQIERVYDIDAALLACFQGLTVATSHRSELEDFKADIQQLFSDDRPGVWLSTIHKAKGLEAERVFILRPDKLPLVWRGQQAWEYEQEMNLKYVAITRSLSELYYVRQAGEAL